MPKRDRTPPEIKAVRQRRERKRLWTGIGFFAAWWIIFITAIITRDELLLWIGWLAVSGEVIVLQGLHERALRKIASRSTGAARRG